MRPKSVLSIVGAAAALGTGGIAATGAIADSSPAAASASAHFARNIEGPIVAIDRAASMSLRVRMLGAFGYILVFTLIALELPLTLNFSRRVDSEIRAEAGAAAHAIAAAASGRLTTRPALASLASDQATRLNGRVLIVDQRGRLLVDSDSAATPGSSYASRHASHQLRTPLTGLRLRLETASLKATDPDLRRDLAAGELETERLAKLLSDLLRLAQDGQRPAPARVGLGAAAGRAAGRWREQAEDGGRSVELADGRAEVDIAASSGDLDTILDNLLENALNYAPPGQPITLDWGRDDAAFVAVLDRGPRIADDEADHIFDRFYRGRSSNGGSVPGTGLGLAIVESLARRWGGSAALVNRPDGGARAEVRFPIAKGSPLRGGGAATMPPNCETPKVAT